MKKITEIFEGVLRRVNTVRTMVFMSERCQWAAKYVTFSCLHVAYFLTLTSAGTFVLWLVPLTTSKRLSLISALYTSVSALATTGLQTVESASLTYFHYCVLIVLMVLGSPTLTSLGPLFVRKYYFHLCIKQFSLERIQQQKLIKQQTLEEKISRESEMKTIEDREWKLETFGDHDHHAKLSYSISSGSEFQSHVQNLRPHNISPSAVLESHAIQLKKSHSISSGAELHHHMGFEYAEGLEGKGSSRVSADAQQAWRTLEYRAMVALSRITVRYLFAVFLIGFLLGALYFLGVGDREVRLLERRGINPYFFAIYSSISAFSNAGYCMTNDNMMAFVDSSGLLLLYAVLASVGNTLYSPMLRLLVWVSYKRASDKDKGKYDYLLRHPRRCYTYLFPRYQTLWLLGAYLFLTGIQIFFVCLLEWEDALQGLSPMHKLVVSYCQGVSTRNAGGLALSLPQLAPALLLIFVVCMYMAVYPLFLSRQTTHVHESTENEHPDILLPGATKKNRADRSEHGILLNQSRRLLARDTTYLGVAMFVLCLSESQSMRLDPINFSIFNMIFEVTSAYGNIGLSVGYDCGLRLDQETPCRAIPYSFSGAWSIVGRLVIIVIMFLGRHRCLADNIDSAIRLPTQTVPNTSSIPSAPQQTSNSDASNTPTIVQWNGDNHPQLELSHTNKPSPSEPSLTQAPHVQNVSLNLWFRPVLSKSCLPPAPAFAPTSIPALPSPVPASESEL